MCTPLNRTLSAPLLTRAHSRRNARFAPAAALGWLDKRFKLSDAQFLGGSTGALTATLAASGCNMDQVYRTADKLSSDVGYWDNGVWGLRGVWGDYIRNWLDACLPADASECAAEIAPRSCMHAGRGACHIPLRLFRSRCNGRLLVALTELAPKFGTHYISEFRDRDDILAVVRRDDAEMHGPSAPRSQPRRASAEPGERARAVLHRRPIHG